MPKEHAGGLHTGLTKPPLEWHADKPFAVTIVNFNFDSLDSIEDQVREALRQGRVEEWLSRYVIHHTEEVRRDAIDAVISEVIAADDPKFRLVCLGFAAGVMAVIKRTMESWGEQFGVSKQNVQNGVDAVSERYLLRKNQTARNDEARENMRMANFRPKAQVPA